MADETGRNATDEFADYEGERIYETVEFRWRNLLGPSALRAFAAVIGGVVLLVANRTFDLVALVVGIVLIVWAVGEALAVRRGRGVLQQLALSGLLLAIGVALLVWPNVTGTAVSRLLAVGLGLASLRGFLRAFGTDESDSRRAWWAIRALLILAVAVALWLVPAVMLSFVLIIVVFIWVMTGIATIIGNLSVDESSESAIGVGDVWPRFFDWLEQRPHTADDRHQLYAKLFYEGVDAARRLSRFFILMGFATAIAVFGIISDSTAVVIGAMLVAPLMAPLMATSLSLVMGWPNRAMRSALVALGGIGLAIGLSALFGAISPYTVDPVANTQVASRIAPSLVDLFVAIAAGGAGAFALSRPDVSDALPGVAVAIALVPPLAVVGLMLVGGHGAETLGALLLFTTNMVAILLTGAGVFVLTGVAPVRQLIDERERIRNATALIGILAILILVVLGTASREIRAEAFDRDEVEQEVVEWIGDRSLELLAYEVTANGVEIVVVGGDEPGDPADLAAAIETELGREVVVTLRWLPEQRFVVDSSSG